MKRELSLILEKKKANDVCMSMQLSCQGHLSWRELLSEKAQFQGV